MNETAVNNTTAVIHTHSSWPCTLIPESYATPSSSSSSSLLHIPPTSQCPVSQGVCTLSPRRKPTMQWAIHSCPLTCGFGGRAMLRSPCFSARQIGCDLQLNRWPPVQLSVCLPFLHFHHCGQTNRQWRVIGCLVSLTSVALIVKLRHVILGVKKNGPLFKGRWINTLIKFPDGFWRRSKNQSKCRKEQSGPHKPPLDTIYALDALQDFSNCKQWWKDWAGTFNYWHLLHSPSE